MPNDWNDDRTVDVPQSKNFAVYSQAVEIVPGYRLGGNFRLEKQLGRGGMGEAWKAYDETADRFVVLKFVPKELQNVQEAMDLVRDSFKKVHALQHQHICPVYGLFNDSEHGLYLVMKFVDGVPLDTYRRRSIEKNGKIQFSDIVQILWGIAQGLDYAHEKKVVHRDIKPQNVMISKTDGVQIIDFGLAEEIRTSMARFSQDAVMSAAGTRPYMSPEQWRGRLQDARTDQYALAVTAYEMFAGHLPFHGSDIGILRECVLNDAPEPIAGLPDYINTALLKALAKNREDRYENCKAFIKAMITKPKETVSGAVPNEEMVQLEDGDPDRMATINLLSYRPEGEPQPPGWIPQTMFTSNIIGRISALISSQTQMTPVKKPLPSWFFPVLGSVMVLFLGLGLFLMKPVMKPITVLPKQITAEPPSVEIGQKQEEKSDEIKEPGLPAEEPTPVVEMITEKTPPESEGIELLKVTEFKNGYLAGFPWVLMSKEGDQFTQTNPNDALVIDVQKRGKLPWSLQLLIGGFSINKSARYLLEFEMKAKEPVTLRFSVYKDSPPFQDTGFTNTYSLETKWKTFHEIFQIDQDKPNARLVIDLFKEENVYEIRRISLRRLTSEEPAAEPIISATESGSLPLLASTAIPIEAVEAQQRFKEELEAAVKPYRSELEKERDLAKKRGDLNQILVLENELKSLNDWKPTQYKPERRSLDIEKIKYKNRIETVKNTHKKTLTELVKELVRTDRIAESKIVQEMVDYFDEPVLVLFDGKNTDHWMGDFTAWNISNKILNNTKRGAIFTKQEFSDFEITLDFFIHSGGNNGLLLRVDEQKRRDVANALEIQISDHNVNNETYNETGALYKHLKPKKNPTKIETWNTMKVRLVGMQLTTWINNIEVMNTNIDTIDKCKRGSIGFSGWNGSTSFRNIKIVPFNK